MRTPRLLLLGASALAASACAPLPPAPPLRPSISSFAPQGMSQAQFDSINDACVRFSNSVGDSNKGRLTECLRQRGLTVDYSYADGRVDRYPPLVQWVAPRPPPAAPAPSYNPPAYQPNAGVDRRPDWSAPTPPPRPAPPRAVSSTLTAKDREAIVHLVGAIAVGYASCKGKDFFRTCMAAHVTGNMYKDVGPVFCGHQDYARRWMGAEKTAKAAEFLNCD